MPRFHKSTCSRFRRDTYRALMRVPRGKVIAYKSLAGYIGYGSARAVGNALAKNPFPVTIPCHRVVCSDGRIGGFSVSLGRKRSGSDLKRRLLESEGIAFDRKDKIPKRFFI